MISVGDLKWLAGFLQGEGSFSSQSHSTPRLAASQVERWPLERCKEIFGGVIYLSSARSSNHPSRFSSKPISLWLLTGGRAAGLMMTLYSLLSPRRQEQIRRVLQKWKSRAAHQKYRTKCPHGHVLVGSNVRIRRNGHRDCRACHRDRKAQYQKDHPERCAMYDAKYRARKRSIVGQGMLL